MWVHLTFAALTLNPSPKGRGTLNPAPLLPKGEKGLGDEGQSCQIEMYPFDVVG